MFVKILQKVLTSKDPLKLDEIGRGVAGVREALKPDLALKFTLTRPVTNPKPYTLKPSTLNCEELTMLTQLQRPARAQFLAVTLIGLSTIQDYTGLL